MVLLGRKSLHWGWSNKGGWHYRDWCLVHQLCCRNSQTLLRKPCSKEQHIIVRWPTQYYSTQRLYQLYIEWWWWSLVDVLLKHLRLRGRTLAERTVLAAKSFGIHENFIKAVYLRTLEQLLLKLRKHLFKRTVIHYIFTKIRMLRPKSLQTGGYKWIWWIIKDIPKKKPLSIQKCLVLSSIRKGIRLNGLINIDNCTNRGAIIGRFIDIIQRETRIVFVHIRGNYI